MPKNKDPAVLFYTSDFLVGVSGLTMQERGQYITLLCLQHQSGHLTEKEIELAVGKPSADVMKKFIRDDDGRYYQHRMEEETEIRCRFVDSRRQNGALGGRPQKPKQNLSVSGRLTYTEATENLPENENINGNINENKVEDEEFFDCDSMFNIEQRFEKRFWPAYPRKVGKAYAKQCFCRLKPSVELTRKMLAAIERQKRSREWLAENGKYIPHPSTWLNQGRWDDEETKISPLFSDFDPEEALRLAYERSKNE
ncbi:MAG: DUF1376 domain-containing protein [Clostridia bacterium]|nr:DUF1376 domain-containing protein [Clostridia bacterium]